MVTKTEARMNAVQCVCGQQNMARNGDFTKTHLQQVYTRMVQQKQVFFKGKHRWRHFVSWLKIMLYKPDELCSGSESGEHPEIVLAGDLANTDVLKVNVFMYFTVSFWFWLAYMSDQKDVLLYLSTVHKMKTKHPDGYFANSSTFEKSKAEDTAGVPTITHISQQSTMYLKYRCNFGDVCSVHRKHRIQNLLTTQQHWNMCKYEYEWLSTKKMAIIDMTSHLCGRLCVWECWQYIL